MGFLREMNHPMKIASVEAIPLEAPIAKPVGRARQVYPIKARRCLLVKITTDEGLVGYGEGLTPVSPLPPAAIVQNILKPFLMGADPLDTEKIWEALYSINSSRGYTKGYQMIAISAVDIALWDLKGKILGQPVYNLLGGAFQDEIPVYLTGLMIDDDIDYIVTQAEEFHAKGFRAMKLKVGANEKRDVATVKALRESLGPDIKLMIDANGGYDVKTAIRVAQKVEPYDIFWFEEPVTPEDVAGLAEVRRQIPMYLAAGECEYTQYAFRDLLLRQALDICQPDVSRAGGITEVRRIAMLARAFNAYYAPHAWGGAFCVAATLHLAKAMPAFLICELDQTPNPLRDELPVGPLDFREGCLHVSSKPGLGVEINEETLCRFRMA
jgi:D-galactarolactone cycloisomerase